MTDRAAIARHPRGRAIGLVLPAALLLSSVNAAAQTMAPGTAPTISGLKLGLVLDGAYTSDDLALGQRSKGFALGHTELTANANIDDWFRGQLTAVLESHDGELEIGLEEAYLETLSMPAGLSIRAGRFLSQVGYLNNQHLHADDFAQRPLLYRAFLGSHYFDDGLRLNYVLPTRVFWQVGVEAFSGRSLVGESTNAPGVGTVTVGTRLGSDIGRNHSWQLGLGYLRNRLDPVLEEEDGDMDHDHDHDHSHSHGAAYTGKNLIIADAVWKWAPDGNGRNRQLRLSAEYARITDLGQFATSSHRHESWYVSAVYRFHPQWETGVRWGDLKVAQPHGDHFHSGRLSEAALMLAYKRSEFSAFRLQFTSQDNKEGFATAGDSLMLQYVMSLGAHGAHSF